MDVKIMNSTQETLTSNAVFLQSLGAAGMVTGSKHLLRTPGVNVMIDCGLFQGIKSLREKNWQPLPVLPSDINALILTHAHLDHCGYIPLLIKNGYTGKIFMASATRDLAELILRDSAKLQEEDAWKANKHGYSRHHPAKPLYDTHDVDRSIPHFVTVEPDEDHKLNDHIYFKFFPAGHIPGACSVAVNCYNKKIFFSGDTGRYSSELLYPPSHPAKADFVIMETSYGNRVHKEGDISNELAMLINDTLLKGGNILIPCFAVGRAQDIIHLTDAKNTILIIGFQAEGTRGRALLNRSPEIKIHGQYYPVRAKGRRNRRALRSCRRK